MKVRGTVAWASLLTPQFDIVLLGMGDDGHTASLFPGTDALGVSDRWVTVGYKGTDPRLTLTLPLLNQARTVMFLVAGESKQEALAQVFSETADGKDYPAKLIQPTGELCGSKSQVLHQGLNFFGQGR